VDVPATTGELALEALRRNAQAFMARAPGATAGVDPEDVHQMRVATRRLRAALRIFSDVLPPEAGRLNDELKWIAAQLGAVRDLDVLLIRLSDQASDLGLAEPLQPYATWLQSERQRCLSALDHAVDSARFGELVEALKATDGWTPMSELALHEDAPRRLRRAYKRFSKRAARITKNATSEELHIVRIRAKRARYTAEFLEPAYGKPVRRLVKRLVRVQDLLGDLQDGVVSSQRIQHVIGTEASAWPPETSVALGRLVQYTADRDRRLRKRWSRVYKDVVDKGWKRLPSKVAIP
jgi:triphosphatase